MVSLQPKNSGGPIVKFWDAPETITALEHVKGWLSKHAKKVTNSSLCLSLYCCQCRFMEKSFAYLRSEESELFSPNRALALVLQPASLKTKVFCNFKMLA